MPARAKLALALLALVVWVPLFIQGAQTAQPASAEQPAAPAKPGYAGNESCAMCHEEISKKFNSDAHKAVDVNKQWKGYSCEGCHGPGAKHAESVDPKDILNPAKLKPAIADRTCLTCHKGEKTNTGRIMAGHARSEVSCLSCHAVHKSPKELLTRNSREITKKCTTCHLSQAMDFQKPHAHRLDTGVMSCVDCHNPHGSQAKNTLKLISGNEPGCFRCHGDKRGPFTFEHAPGRVESCSTCHELHGSNNPRMLARHEVSQLCLECHSNLSTTGNVAGGPATSFHDIRQARYRQCTVCHQKIHGSHVNRDFLR
jgi:DmsE family decaheme c-type cytochrome